MEDGIQFRPLGKVRNVVEAMGLDITHMHEDLIFVEHSAFLLRFDDECDDNLFIHFNTDCSQEDANKIFMQISGFAEVDGLSMLKDKPFKMSSVEGKDEIRLEFMQ